METFEHEFNAWMRPAGIVDSSEVVSARKSVALGLRDDDIDDYDLVLAAFGRLDDELRELVETRLQQSDPTHATGKKNLVELLCASAVLSAMERMDEQSVDLALLTQSAIFRGMKPRVKALSGAAASVMATAAARSRERVIPRKVSARAQAAASSETVDVAAINALATRLEYAIGHFDSQLQLLNEEVDVLWWSRTGRDSNGKSWSEYSELERAIGATIELAELLAELPATGAVFEVLREITDGSKRRFETYGEVCVALAALEPTAQVDSSFWLLPLFSGARIVITYPEDARAGVALAELGLENDLKIKVVDIPEQLLREMAIIKRVL
jgi:hypothetical protein